jgi:hypothetical protein
VPSTSAVFSGVSRAVSDWWGTESVRCDGRSSARLLLQKCVGAKNLSDWFCNLQGAGMAIGNAVQRGGFVYIYDEQNHKTGTVSAGSEKEDGLKGYTSSTVNVRRGAFIYSFDEKGHQKSARPAQ